MKQTLHGADERPCQSGTIFEEFWGRMKSGKEAVQTKTRSMGEFGKPETRESLKGHQSDSRLADAGASEDREDQCCGALAKDVHPCARAAIVQLCARS